MRSSKFKIQSSKFIFLFVFSLFAIHCSLFTASAETTIRVLLLNGKYSKIPHKDEKVEKIGNAHGEVFLGGIKYPGTVDVWRGENGLYIVNEVPLEDYVKGVVTSEVGSKWDMEALKAQAVVARTYALYQKQNNGANRISYHLTSSVLHQVYKGSNIPEAISKAVDVTRGEILVYDNVPILAYYHSTSGGMTEDPVEVFGRSYPYLKSIETNCELSPYYMWEKRIPIIDIEKANNISGLKDILIDSFTDSNRVKNFRIITETEEIVIAGKDFRRNLGWDKLPSTMITNLTRSGNFFIFEGKGYGHGVGMCQWTTLELAKQGKSYREILSTFYPGASLLLYENR